MIFHGFAWFGRSFISPHKEVDRAVLFNGRGGGGGSRPGLSKIRPGGTSQIQGRNVNFFWCDHRLGTPLHKILTIFQCHRQNFAIFRLQRQNLQRILGAAGNFFEWFFNVAGKFFAVFRFRPFGPHYSVNFQYFGPHFGLFSFSKQLFRYASPAGEGRFG